VSLLPSTHSTCTGFLVDPHPISSVPHLPPLFCCCPLLGWWFCVSVPCSRYVLYAFFAYSALHAISLLLQVALLAAHLDLFICRLYTLIHYSLPPSLKFLINPSSYDTHSCPLPSTCNCVLFYFIFTSLTFN